MWAKFGTIIDMIVKNWALIVSCYVLTLFFIHTTSTCIVRLGDIFALQSPIFHSLIGNTKRIIVITSAVITNICYVRRCNNDREC